MNLLQLKYFVAIAEEGSITRASHRLYVAQPSLSQHVRNLEEELGVELLRRTPRGIELTDEGDELLQHARIILGQVEQARAAVHDAGGDPSGEVAIGMPPTVSERIAVPLVLKIRETMPRVALRIVEGMSGYVLNWLLEGRVDVGVLYGVQQAGGIESTEVCHEDLYLITQAGEAAGEVTFADLAARRLILPGTHSGLRTLLDGLAQRCEVDLDVQVEVDALGQMRALVEAGVGATVLPDWAVAAQVAAGTLVAHPVVEPPLTRTLHVAHASDRPLPNAQRAVMAALREVLAAD